MIALVRYTLATLLHSQRYLAPLLLFLAGVGVVSSNDQGPLPPVYGACAAMLFISAVWLTIALISAEDPAHRAIVIVSAGSPRRVLLASIWVACLGCLVFSAMGLVVPLVFGTHVVTVMDLLVGLMAELTCAAVGIAVGLICSRLVVRRQGYALVAALAFVLAFLLTPGLVPVNAVLQSTGRDVAASELAVPIGGFLLIAVVLLAVSGTITHLVSTRRD